MNAPNLTQAEQQEYQQRMERKSIQMAILQFSRLTQQCFEPCVEDFTSKTLGSREEACLTKCFEKFHNGQTRIAQRFQENMAVITNNGQGGF
ncbi:mitochondrial import inner membrane translocase subunit TIM9 [Microthyrium microscopicum]|uniref:Mitochondrial import inner membrane translocase subunit n=1 Tax=Microthyrium microscopicum TaxID=703497 RepID=A0A6A6U585_9PEZI|nr:mitochondrial import inner membrane translocase subunit TIM9 [Microthyrium microscopicum]